MTEEEELALAKLWERYETAVHVGDLYRAKRHLRKIRHLEKQRIADEGNSHPSQGRRTADAL